MWSTGGAQSDTDSLKILVATLRELTQVEADECEDRGGRGRGTPCRCLSGPPSSIHPVAKWQDARIFLPSLGNNYDRMMCHFG